VLGVIIIEIIEMMAEHLRQGCLARLPWAGEQDNFSLEVFPNVFFQVSFHGDYSTLHSEKVETFSE
jgi:hypothetical protein